MDREATQRDKGRDEGRMRGDEWTVKPSDTGNDERRMDDKSIRETRKTKRKNVWNSHQSDADYSTD